MKKRVLSILLTLVMLLALLPTAALAEETTPSSLESTTFGYAYDVQRSPAYPAGVGTKMTCSDLSDPITGGKNGTTRKETSSGTWTLTKFGTYSYYKSSGVGTETTNKNLNGLVTTVATKYNITNPDTVVIHELKDAGSHICYGIVIAYDATEGYAAFLGDFLSGGAGYLLSTTFHSSSDEVEITVGQIATDFVKENTYGIELAPTSLTFDAADYGYAQQASQTVTIKNTGSAATGKLKISVSNDDFVVAPAEIETIALNDETTFTVTPKTGLSAGTHNATVTVSGPNIVSKTVIVNFVVNSTGKLDQAALNIVGKDTITYGETLTLTAEGGTTQNAVAWSVDNPGIATIDENGVLIPKKAGTVTVTAIKPGDDQYNAVQATKNITINKTDVTVTVADQSAYVNEQRPENSYTCTGLVGEDQLGGNIVYQYYQGGTLVQTVDMTKAGTYTIKAANLTVDTEKYNDIHYVDGTLTIKAVSTPSVPSVSVPTYPVNTPSSTDNGSVSASTKNAASGSTVTITVKPDEGYQLSGLTVTDSKGNALPLTDLGNGKYSFVMPASKVDVSATFAKEVEVSPFRDVVASAYYYDAVKWAVENGITDGIGNGLFAPNTSCTRAQIVTFLWRAAGSPEPKNMSSFKDVAADAYYAKAVAWAVENGITTGTVTDKFSPNESCTRAQSVAFLFRAAKASATGAPTFSDVAANAYYAEAVKWAVDNGVTDGVGNGKFAPNDACTRAQIVTFLWRLHTGK